MAIEAGSEGEALQGSAVESVGTPPVDGATTAGIPPAEPSVAAEGQEEPTGKSAPPASKEDLHKTSLLKRVDRLTARLRSAEQALVAAQAGGKAASPQDEATIARLVDERAEVLAEARLSRRQADAKAQETYDTGVATFGKEAFAGKVELLKSIRDETDDGEMARYNQFISALIKTGEGPRLIHGLADDLGEATRLMNLAPLDLGLELARLAQKEPPKPVSGAPKPITTIGAKGSAHTPLRVDSAESDRLDTATWMKRRIADAEAKNKEFGRRIL